MDPKDLQTEPIEPTPEEQAAEQEQLKGVTAEEIKLKLAEEMGIDPETEADLLDKLTQKELAHRETQSKIIKQKIAWREKAKGSQTKEKDNPNPGKTQKTEQPDFDKLVDEKLQARLDARDLEELTVSDELKTEIKDLAKLKGISVRDAAKHPYIKSLQVEAERIANIENATPKRRGGGTYQVKYDPSKPLSPEDFALDTEEGRKAWAEAKEARRKAQEQ